MLIFLQGTVGDKKNKHRSLPIFLSVIERML
jgi:hypothetical protein